MTFGMNTILPAASDATSDQASTKRRKSNEHFADLTGVLSALLDREGERALGSRWTSCRANPAGKRCSSAQSASIGYLLAVRADPVTWRLVLLPPEGARELLRERIERARAAVVAELARLIEQTYEPVGGRRSPDPELTASSMSALAITGPG